MDLEVNSTLYIFCSNLPGERAHALLGYLSGLSLESSPHQHLLEAGTSDSCTEEGRAKLVGIGDMARAISSLQGGESQLDASMIAFTSPQSGQLPMKMTALSKSHMDLAFNTNLANKSIIVGSLGAFEIRFSNRVWGSVSFGASNEGPATTAAVGPVCSSQAVGSGRR